MGPWGLLVDDMFGMFLLFTPWVWTIALIEELAAAIKATDSIGIPKCFLKQLTDASKIGFKLFAQLSGMETACTSKTGWSARWKKIVTNASLHAGSLLQEADPQKSKAQWDEFSQTTKDTLSSQVVATLKSKAKKLGLDNSGTKDS